MVMMHVYIWNIFIMLKTMLREHASVYMMAGMIFSE